MDEEHEHCIELIKKLAEKRTPASLE